MVESTREIAIDVGGGEGEYFVERARLEPDKTFLVLEPRRLRLRRKPPNLRIIQWRNDKDSSFPLKLKSVDETNINFLCGEIRDRKGATHTTGLTKWESYRRLLHNLKSVLKNGGLVRIVDTRNNIGGIRGLLEKEGYTIVLPPIYLKEERTFWAKHFFVVFRMTGMSELLPMTIEARWEPD